jgi:hypothetical protein
MPTPRPFDLGNVLATAEGIKNARYSRDPNSLANQLLAAKIGSANDLGGGLKMAPISFKDATAESIAAAMQANDPSLLKRVPYKPWSVDTKAHRIFYDINPVTRESREIARIPIENFTAAYDAAAGGAAVAEGLPNPRANTSVTPSDLDLPATTASKPAIAPSQPYVPKSEAELTRDKTTAQEEAKTDALTRRGEVERLVELSKNKTKNIQRLKGTEFKIDLVRNEIKYAKTLVRGGWLNTGWSGSKLADTPGTPAFNLKESLKTIKANIGFDRLQEMRDTSPTGGALGQVAVQELENLQAVYGSLEQGQNEEQLIRNLDIVDGQIAASWARIANAYEQDYGVKWDGISTSPSGTSESPGFNMEDYNKRKQRLLSNE